MKNILKTENAVKIIEQQIKKFNTQKKTTLNKYNIYEGNLLITNSISAIRITEFDASGITSIQDDSYPNDALNRLFEGLFEHNILLHVTGLKNVFQFLQADNKNGATNISFVDNQIVISPASNHNKTSLAKMEVRSLDTISDPFDFNVNPRLMLDALMFFSKLKIKNVYLYHNGNRHRPFKLVGGNVEYLITPMG